MSSLRRLWAVFVARNKEFLRDRGALAWNLMFPFFVVFGMAFAFNGRNQEALWPYLWVDVIYHQDKQEHIKAMEQLARLFEEQGDKTRAKQYRERLKGMTR